ncbi:hypothetical protein FAZ15_13830 [Sphingobacterium olei]|uniref:Uncharacterized protein n=1 Tax=Sphingobacterium olei TaxID=2571155 RepID=A0A4U0PBE0_9SPHI|nr:hypothetical protein [Sphingobacterium olei]TJZ59964.1 hypothetical protein FAZ15_13830 [Sphingobacterium olei]
MKKMIIFAFSVMTFTVATAQQKVETVIKTDAQKHLKADGGNMEGKYTSQTNAKVHPGEIQSKVEQKKTAVLQKVTETKKSLLQQVPTSEATGVVDQTLHAEVNGQTVTTSLQAGIASETGNNIGNNIGSVLSQPNTAIDGIGTTTSNAIKAVSTIHSNVKTDIKVAPIKVNTSITSGLGLRL